MDLTPRTTSTQLPQDTRWRTSKHGQDAARPIQLDASKFTGDAIATYDTPEGSITVIKSGVALAEVGGFGVPWDETKTDGTEVLAGFLNDNEGVIVTDKANAKPGAALLKHGIVDVSKLPVASQRTALADGATKSTCQVVLV